ncbi:conserved hypothetical protein [Rhodospirillaceae bacterium LM-1]|nr:conserved hypothetical protein [Rhodospirillaceae bacterium LM-1]
MTAATRSYEVADIARQLGVSPTDLPAQICELIRTSHLEHRPIEGRERDALILRVIRELEKPLEVAGEHRLPRWEMGWGENLDAFIASGYDFAALVPKFVRPGEPVRIQGEYIQPISTGFDVDYIRILVTWLYARYFDQTSEIHEFGCGTSQNLIPAAQLYPGRPLFGYDWAKPSQGIIDLLAEHRGINIKGQVFDMFRPDPSVKLAPGAGVITIGSLEQLGTKIDPFLDFLIERRPAVVANMDSFNELYDPEHLPDALALRYDRKRGYLEGWVSKLRALEAKGVIEFLDQRRGYGNIFHEGHGYVVWRVV